MQQRKACRFKKFTSGQQHFEHSESKMSSNADLLSTIYISICMEAFSDTTELWFPCTCVNGSEELSPDKYFKDKLLIYSYCVALWGSFQEPGEVCILSS